MFVLISIYHPSNIFSSSFFFCLICIRVPDLMYILASYIDECQKNMKQLLLLLQVYTNNIKNHRTSFCFFFNQTQGLFFLSLLSHTNRNRIYDNYTDTIEREQKVDKIIQLETCLSFIKQQHHSSPIRIFSSSSLPKTLKRLVEIKLISTSLLLTKTIEYILLFIKGTTLIPAVNKHVLSLLILTFIILSLHIHIHIHILSFFSYIISSP